MSPDAVQAQPPPQEEPRPLDPNVLQRKAADPFHSVWVGASAGSGKTKVLTDRVLRLMLPREGGAPGTPAHKILCLTFTKAAASEMALRLSQKLGAWAVLPEAALQEDLEKLLGRAPTRRESEEARKLFAQAIDAPGGLKIMTLHSFCQSVLARFPLEAGLTPGFSVLEESQSAALLKAACLNILNKAREMPASEIGEALHNLASAQNEEQFALLLKGLVSERHQLHKVLARFQTHEGLYTAICRKFEILPGLPEKEFLLQECGDPAFQGDLLRKAAHAMLDSAGKTDRQRGALIARWLSQNPPERAQNFETYRGAFLTKDGAVFKKPASDGLLKAHPDLSKILGEEAARLSGIEDTICKISCACLTRHLMALGAAIFAEYKMLKARRGALDFDDLVIKTRDLLKGSSLDIAGENSAAWVLFKLDQGIDHILVDEAQDTNPEQWEIIETLCSEFYAHAEHTGRTLFVVGDEKQSIFSFQRAAPQEFSRMKDFFSRTFRESGKNWDEVPMNISFRSSRAVLEAVDAVFSSPEMREGLSAEEIAHTSFRRKQGGLVELWPLFETQKAEEPDPWTPPVTISPAQSGAAACAEYVAEKIAGWLKTGEELPSRARPLHAGDIMILVRTRTGFVAQLTRALKMRGVPVSGADRMILHDDLAIMDLTALAETALLPEDDLTLACVLKSPLFGWDEEQLFALAAGRTGSLWAALENHETEHRYIRDLITLSRTARPYEFFSHILDTPCPADPISALRAMKARLGEEILDPIEEFLSLCQAFEKDNLPALQIFLHAFSREQNDIKRQIGDSPEAVRIMTVHSAKGLQAPIVILPDTAAKPGPEKLERLLWPDKTDLDFPLFAPRKDGAPALYRSARDILMARQEEEYRRLLYVAMTRAEDRLYITGHTTPGRKIERSWYAQCQDALAAHPDSTRDGDIIRLSGPQTGAPDRREEPPKTLPETISESLPPWLFEAVPPEPSPPLPLTPSRPSGEDEDAASSPLAGKETYRFRRGNVTHKLLEFLPALPDEEKTRKEAAARFLTTYAPDLPEDVRSSILRETLKILSHPEYAPFFGPGSQAEVPLTGLLPDGRLISGRIDRLLIGEKDLWIVDYKTNRPPPRDLRDIPRLYRAQMQAYRDALSQIYPTHRIHCALLWTDGPFLNVL